MTILAAVDFSAPAMNAARAAALLARQLKCRLILSFVIESTSPLPPAAAKDGQLEYARTGAALRLGELRAALAVEGVAVDTRILVGRPAEAIAVCAADEQASVIVMGTTGISDLLLGKVSRRMLLEADCPILVLRAASAPFDEWVSGRRPLRVVAGADLSRDTEVALTWLNTLRRSAPCDVTLVHVYSPPAAYHRFRTGCPSVPIDTDPRIVSALREELAPVVSRLEGQGRVTLKIHGSWGRVVDRLTREAHAEDADLLVVGTHALGTWSHRLNVDSAARGTRMMSPPAVIFFSARTSRPLARHSSAIPTIRKVLAATDLSTGGNAAVPHAYALLRAGGGVVHLCHVHETRMLSADEDDVATTSLAAKARRQLESDLRGLVPDSARAFGVSSLVEVIEGASVATEIVRAAERADADVIVLAGHGRSDATQTLMGAVTEMVMKDAPCPVYLVRGP